MSNFSYEKDTVVVNAAEGTNVTSDMMDRLISKKHGYEKSIKEIIKVGKYYIVRFAEGFTAFGQTERLARRVTEVMWLSRVATEEKNLGKTQADYMKEFAEKNIYTNGKDIPQFIDTVADREAQIKLADKKAKEAAEAKAKKEAKAKEDAANAAKAEKDEAKV